MLKHLSHPGVPIKSLLLDPELEVSLQSCDSQEGCLAGALDTSMFSGCLGAHVGSASPAGGSRVPSPSTLKPAWYWGLAPPGSGPTGHLPAPVARLSCILRVGQPQAGGPTCRTLLGLSVGGPQGGGRLSAT